MGALAVAACRKVAAQGNSLVGVQNRSGVGDDKPACGRRITIAYGGFGGRRALPLFSHYRPFTKPPKSEEPSRCDGSRTSENYECALNYFVLSDVHHLNHWTPLRLAAWEWKVHRGILQNAAQDFDGEYSWLDGAMSLVQLLSISFALNTRW
jgi:hypothetical protein